MANVILVQAYQIGTAPQPVGGVSIGIGVAQIASVRAVTGTPTTVNGSYVYSVITMAGTTQFPGARYFTGLTVAQVITATG